MTEKKVDNYLKELRDAKGWSQEELSAKSNVGRTVISQFENGEKRPKPSTIMKLANALGCTYSEIFSGKSNYYDVNLILKSKIKYYSLATDAAKKFLDKNLYDKVSDEVIIYLSSIIDEYENSENTQKKLIIEKFKNNYAKNLAENIFTQLHEENN